MPRRDDKLANGLLKKLEGIINDDATNINSKLKAIALLGKELGLFIEQKKVQIDIRALVSNLSTEQLSQIVASHETKVLEAAEEFTEAEVVDHDG